MTTEITPVSAWTDEKLKRLEALWMEGKSSGECAAALNSEFPGTVTRNAVIGKVHRLVLANKIPQRGPLVGRQSHTGAREIGRIPKTRKSRQKAEEPVAVAAVPSQPPVVPQPLEEQPAPRLELVREERDESRKPALIYEVIGCRWPVDVDAEGRHLFCNANRPNGKPYCDHHRAKATTRLPVKQLDPAPAHAGRRALVHPNAAHLWPVARRAAR